MKNLEERQQVQRPAMKRRQNQRGFRSQKRSSGESRARHVRRVKAKL